MTSAPENPSAARTIVITGAGSGIGKATAQLLLARGWNVVLAGRTEATLAQASDGHDKALVVPADVTDPDAVDALFTRAAQRFGRVDVLFNNAGVFGPAVPIDELSPQAWEEVCSINLTGAMNAARAAFAHFKLHGGGRIINNGSISAQVPRVNSVAYSVTKHAIAGLTKSLELDGRPYRIRATQLDIGNTASDLLDDFGATQGALQPSGQRLVEPTFPLAEAADAVAYIAGIPLGTSINQFTITAGGMPYIGRG
ncbi:SDR family oxidoreductase [Glutamicibacter soli]|uniref:SDR family NAD(P)-dependent oxidoreductase n=1 Tax=Glutamicibacter soli TaxID=453836 RepID=A0A365YFP2_9MICC|nr:MULTISPECIES: SDR family oxidoreductase [Micrococcaceae]ALQ29251.1 short-chain dehydrogenase [Arthrobacter sp. YC-RL1]KLI89352.1 short-chain dehydrogenase [Arthrobacter sp. YC-RL1]RBM01110.1 SDR family NAD(P)-dependent oxidoreductase [Glutamicibacter soli]RKS16768.1 NADP-dependent 3-hydroxy acid dehydrogenase YdfG [Arthrobacter sp. AG1021]